MDKYSTAARKGALYLRKSRADLEKERLGEFETLAKHERELTAMAEKMELPIDDVYREIVSGESISERAEFRRLMDGVARREYAYVICHAIDRLGRGDMMEYGWVLSTFQYSHTLIVTPGKTYDPTDIYDIQALQMQMIIASGELHSTKRRLKAGKESSAKEGQHVASRAPYGYDKTVTSNRKKTLVPNKDADVIRELFARVAAGEAKAAVARDFNKRGLRTSLDKSWTPKSVMCLLQNPVYKGMIRWGYERTVIDGRDGMMLRKAKQRRGDEILVEGLHEPLVSEELWEEANRKAIVSPRGRIDYDLRNPLARVLKCKHCGRTMNWADYKFANGDGKEYIYYRHRHYSKCPNIKVKMHQAGEVIGAVVEALTELAGQYEMVVTDGDDGAKTHADRLASMYAAMKELERQQNKLVELYTAEAITLEEFRDRRHPLDERVEALQGSILEEEEFKPKPIREIAIQLREAVALLADSSISAQVRNDALCAVVERIDYDDIDGQLQLGIHLRET